MLIACVTSMWLVRDESNPKTKDITIASPNFLNSNKEKVVNVLGEISKILASDEALVIRVIILNILWMVLLMHLGTITLLENEGAFLYSAITTTDNLHKHKNKPGNLEKPS